MIKPLKGFIQKVFTNGTLRLKFSEPIEPIEFNNTKLNLLKFINP